MIFFIPTNFFYVLKTKKTIQQKAGDLILTKNEEVLEHQQVNIKINNQCISVDKDLANIIIRLNDLGYKTSGCCIGADEAWVIIQEVYEYKIITLMNMLSDCNYVIEKSSYRKNKDIDIIYVQYILKTSGCNKLKCINEWENALKNNVSINFVKNVQYRAMETLFEN